MRSCQHKRPRTRSSVLSRTRRSGQRTYHDAKLQQRQITTCCSSGLKNISRKESEDALTLDGKTIKVATEQFTAITDPDHTQRAVSREEEPSMYKDYVQDRLPEISDRCGAAASCLYTVTPDSNFVIDVHPDNDRVIIASPCSGHGFKHSAAIGEALAEQVIDGKARSISAVSA